MDATQFNAVMQQVAAQNQQQIQQMQNQHAQQMQQLAQQIAAPVNPPIVAAAAVPRGPRLTAPTPFDGRAATLDDWTASMDRQFEWYATPDADRVRLAVAHTQGPAWDWWSTLAAPRPATWPLLQTALRRRFQPVNSAETARAKLIALSQGKQSVNEYVDHFRRLLVRIPDMGAADQLFQFTRGLRPALATQLRVQGVATMDAAINLAVRVGSLSEMGAQAASSSGSSSNHAPMDLDNIEGLKHDTAATSTDAPVTRAEFQQLLNAMRDNRRGASSSSSSSSSNSSSNKGRFTPRGLPTISHLTPDQVKEYMDSNKCFGCASKDHRSRQCPKRKVGADGRVSWSN